MAIAARRGGGFWLGVLTGLVVAAAVGALLALAFPPLPSTPPEILPETELTPAAPVVPSDAARSAVPPVQRALIRGDGPAPLVADRQGVELSPDLQGLSPPVASDVFEGAPSGSPSLMPPDGGVITLRPAPSDG